MKFEGIAGIRDLEALSEGSPWQDFEKLVGFILGKHGFSVAVNSVKTSGKKRRQFDVIAGKGNRVCLIECKKWSGRRYRLSALKRAVGQHRERTAFYESITNEDAIPFIVTLVEEEIRMYEGVPLVPIHRLNSFVAELDCWTEGTSFCYYDADPAFPDEVTGIPDDLSYAGGFCVCEEDVPFPDDEAGIPDDLSYAGGWDHRGKATGLRGHHHGL